MSSEPHASWAEVYDLAYRRSFGDFYERFTDATVDAIARRIAQPAELVDFGAGTGRLAIPLAEMGYAVTAVEPCAEMLQQLKNKDASGRVRTERSRMEDFRGEGGFDAALCVFTVILYLLDETTLVRSFEAAHAALRPGGVLILDVPSEVAFRGYSRRDEVIERVVTVTGGEDGLYTYREELLVQVGEGAPSRFVDEFRIRHWHFAEVTRALQGAGFSLVEDLSDEFSGSGSRYYMFRSVDPGADSRGRRQPR